MTHQVILDVTQRLVERSQEARAAFLARTEVQAEAGKGRVGLSCGNLLTPLRHLVLQKRKTFWISLIRMWR